LTICTRNDSIILNFHEYTVTNLLHASKSCQCPVFGGESRIFIIGGNRMGQTEKSYNSGSVQPNRSAKPRPVSYPCKKEKTPKNSDADRMHPRGRIHRRFCVETRQRGNQNASAVVPACQ
jgi:hypothetical protein